MGSRRLRTPLTNSGSPERAEGILEDHLDLAPERLALGTRHRHQIDHLPLAGAVQHLAGHRIDRPQDRARQGQPRVKGLTLMVNSIYNGSHFEDLWLED